MEVTILFEGEFIKGCFSRFILFMFVGLIFGVNFFEYQERFYLEEYSVDPKCKLLFIFVMNWGELWGGSCRWWWKSLTFCSHRLGEWVVICVDWSWEQRLAGSAWPKSGCCTCWPATNPIGRRSSRCEGIHRFLPTSISPLNRSAERERGHQLADLTWFSN